MKVILYGTTAERDELTEALAALPDCSYRNIQIAGYSDYDGFIAGLGESPPECVVVTMNGAEGMEGVIAARDLWKIVPVIWFSDDNGFGVQSYRLGCAYFHKKPISAGILSAAIAKCV